MPHARFGAEAMNSSDPKTRRFVDRLKLFRSKGWRFSILLCIVIAACSVFLLWSRNRVPVRSGLLPSTASSDSNQSLRLKGTTEAVDKRAIQTPLLAGEKSGMLTIVKLTPAGTLVKRGDILVEFDRQDQLRDFINGDAGRHHLHFGYAAYLVPALAARATV